MHPPKPVNQRASILQLRFKSDKCSRAGEYDWRKIGENKEEKLEVVKKKVTRRFEKTNIRLGRLFLIVSDFQAVVLV